MRFRLVMIDSPEPLRAVIDRWEHIRAGGELNRSAVNAALRIDAQSHGEGRSRSPQAAESTKI